MTLETITSRDNSLLRRIRAVRDGKIEEAIFVEGMRLCEEAILSALPIEAVVISEELARKDKAQALLKELDQATDRVASVSENLLGSISYTKTPQGVVLLARRPQLSEEDFKARQLSPALVVVLNAVNNPVNVGAVLRTAEAAGASGVITTANTSDPFSPKALRGAMGSAFRLPIWSGASYTDVIDWCAQAGIETVCTDLNGTVAYTEIDWRTPRALIMGPESTGLSPDEVSQANAVVKIPMQGKVESLNVGVAAAIVLYEAARQRASLGER